MTIKRLAPGVYLEVEADALHLDIEEMLVHHGYADTTENRDLLTRVAREMFEKVFPSLKCSIAP